MTKVNTGLLIGLALLGGALALGGHKSSRKSSPSSGNGGRPSPEEEGEEGEDDDIVVEDFDEDGFTPAHVPEPASLAILDRVEHGVAKIEDSKWKMDGRDMQLVNGLVLHQMAFSRGDDPSRYDKVTAHFIITPNGQISQIQPLDRWLYASHGINRYSVSVEFAGNFPNSQGKYYKPEKFGRNTLTDAQVRAGRFLVDHLIDVLPQLGSPGLQGIYAHRQTSASRGGDPGPDIWYYVGEWAKKERDLGPDNDYTLGTGKPIPEAWTRPRQVPVA